ncbi:glutaredoxin 2 [Actinobacillus succinogenes]|uniref:Glutaredoxin, GrxB family n=1 Tax=Actinobacillus succinogenes (strain ATCC 55618 / DSM 22257 / CCUG 43843 / 130Z) TaxID=339671 RepID=A6VNZ1_ACTSZ|nr:glutaredoxin 2 [Actinobacillus succinogenes]ABR74688.1 glutaredoxin, GrxB family [Actinobacillus succinogenes 130Z]PHI40890.1 glutaredoxin 2 [Actinobacillus succinogenes]
MKLYVYDHCPYCVRVRMIFGLKNVPVEQIVLANDDEETPIKLVGKKVVPILLKDDGEAMPESLDIVKYTDEHFGSKILDESVRPELEVWMKRVGGYYNHLLLPRFVQLGLAEFATQSAIDYFTKKKTEFIGDFAENLADSQQYIERLNQDLPELSQLLKAEDKANGVQVSLEDIMLFPMLRNLTCVNGLVWLPNIQRYVEQMSALSRVPLYTNRAI